MVQVWGKENIMIALIAFAAATLATPLASRLLAAAIATLLGVALIVRSWRVGRDILGRVNDRRGLDYDRRSTRAERRAMRKGLKLALDQTEFRSLLPKMMATAERWAGRLSV